MFQYRIHPEQSLVIVKYEGEIRLNEILNACRAFSSDPAFMPHYNAVCDVRKADMLMSRHEVAELASVLCNEVKISGRWAHIIDSPASAVTASRYSQQCEKFHENNMFSTIEAAADYLEIEELNKYLEWEEQCAPTP